ncbi:hypothetical protein T484DRAFT_1768307 [Baffinella frigidus]|nr:hypothetical protein T484DRAFT_1768307 [Cryptophyta sp. CCMP2293]
MAAMLGSIRNKRTSLSHLQIRYFLQTTQGPSGGYSRVAAICAAVAAICAAVAAICAAVFPGATIANISAGSSRDSVALERQAQACGCAATMLAPPFFYAAASDQGIETFFSEGIETFFSEVLLTSFAVCGPFFYAAASEEGIETLFSEIRVL